MHHIKVLRDTRYYLVGETEPVFLLDIGDSTGTLIFWDDYETTSKNLYRDDGGMMIQKKVECILKKLGYERYVMSQNYDYTTRRCYVLPREMRIITQSELDQYKKTRYRVRVELIHLSEESLLSCSPFSSSELDKKEKKRKLS
jgi:hypothetical protein